MIHKKVLITFLAISFLFTSCATFRKLDGDDDEARYRQIQYLHKNMRYEQALQKIYKFKDNFEKSKYLPNVLLIEANIYEKNEDFQWAYLTYQSYLDQFPNSKKLFGVLKKIRETGGRENRRALPAYVSMDVGSNFLYSGKMKDITDDSREEYLALDFIYYFWIKHGLMLSFYLQDDIEADRQLVPQVTDTGNSDQQLGFEYLMVGYNIRSFIKRNWLWTYGIGPAVFRISNEAGNQAPYKRVHSAALVHKFAIDFLLLPSLPLFVQWGVRHIWAPSAKVGNVKGDGHALSTFLGIKI
jgi:tetratricopeptide (TPR) repeat protein